MSKSVLFDDGRAEVLDEAVIKAVALAKEKAAAKKKAKTKKAPKAKAKAAAAGSDASDNEEENDEEEDRPVVSEAEMNARIAKMTRMLLFQRHKLAIEYTPDKRKVQEISATTFTKHAINASTLCIVCKSPIMGYCSSCHLIEDGGSFYAVHHDCFACTHSLDQEHLCCKSPLVSDDADNDDVGDGDQECYIEHGMHKEPMPVCASHINLHNLDIPKYDHDDVKHIQRFFQEKGFVIIKVPPCPLLSLFLCL